MVRVLLLFSRFAQCTLQQYVDDVFETILHVDDSLPPAVKYLFDFLDNAAIQHGINDPEVTHIWKSNRLTYDDAANSLFNSVTLLQLISNPRLCIITTFNFSLTDQFFRYH